MKRNLFALLAFCSLSAFTAPAFSQDVTELLRADLRTTKTAIITEAMGLDSAQSDVFWPIYREYEAELVTLNDNALALIKDYAANYENMTDDKARDLLKQQLSLDEDRMKLRKSYVGKFEKVLPAKKVARYFQIENKLDVAVQYEAATSIPLVQ